MTNNSEKIVYKPPSFECLNCDCKIPWDRPRKLFCSDICRDEAKYVRYVRKCKKDGRINDPEIQEAIRIRFVHIVSGGYHEKERRIPIELREAVIAHNDGKCQVCGRPGTDIDHIDGDSNDLNNLQLVCRKCHNKKTISQFIQVGPEDERYWIVQEKRIQLDTRIDAEEPIRLCDNEENWVNIYKQIEAERKKKFYKSIFPIIHNLNRVGFSFRSIAKQLNDNKIPTFVGYGKWDHKMTSKIFNNEVQNFS